MKKNLLLSASIGLGLLNAQNVIYSQANTNAQTIVSDALANGNFIASADDFKLTSQSTITKIRVEGKQGNDANTFDTNVSTGALVYIYADSGGKPAGIPNNTATSAPIAMVDVAKGGPGYSLVRSGLLYTFEIDLTLALPSTSVVLQPNTTYWLVFIAKTNLTSILDTARFNWWNGQIVDNHAQIIDPSNLIEAGLTQWTTLSTATGDANTGGFTFSIDGITSVLGTDEVYNSIKPVVSPNPTSDYLFIKSKTKSNVDKISVFDVSGRKLNVNFDGEKIDVRNLQTGNYIINIETDGKNYTEKFIKK